MSLPMTVNSPRQQKQRLDGAKDRARRSRERRKQAQDAFREAQQAKDQEALKLAAAELAEADGEHEMATELERRALSAIVGSIDQSPTWGANLEAQDTLRRIASSDAPLSNYVQVGEFRTANEMAELTGRALASSVWAAGSVTLPDLETDLPGARLGQVQTISPQQTLLDFFGSYVMSDRTVSYVARNGAAVPSASVQVPGAVKQAADVAYSAETAEAETVASWVKSTRQDLDDFGGLQNDLGNALSYGVRHKVEQMLVDAITGASGVGAPTFTGFTPSNAVDRVAIAVAEQKVLGAQVNFAAFHPLDWVRAGIERGTNSAGGYLLGDPFGPGGPLAGVTPVQAVAIPAGHALVGDSLIGAKLGIRSGLQVSVGEESDDRIRNLLTILVECRIAPIVLVPMAFSYVPLT